MKVEIKKDRLFFIALNEHIQQGIKEKELLEYFRPMIYQLFRKNNIVGSVSEVYTLVDLRTTKQKKDMEDIRLMLEFLVEGKEGKYLTESVPMSVMVNIHGDNNYCKLKIVNQQKVVGNKKKKLAKMCEEFQKSEKYYSEKGNVK